MTVSQYKFVLLLSFIALFATQTSAQGFLRRSDTSIVNNNGAVFLKGYNTGNWLVNEGNIMGITKSTIQSPSQIRAAIKSLLGNNATKVDSFYKVWKKNYVSKRDIDSLSALGFNSIRVPFHYADFYDTVTRALLPAGFKCIDSIISWCKPKNMYVILDMHCAPGGQNAEPHSDSKGSADLWINYTTNRPIVGRVWKYIANYYKTETTIGGYDLLNEPVDNSIPRKIRSLYVEVTDSIRSVDVNHMIIAEGNFWGSSLWELAPTQSNADRWDNNLCFSIHNYWTDIPSPNINDQVYIRKVVHVPLLLGESGENSNHWYSRQVSDLTNKNIGWLWWTHKKMNTITAPFSVPMLAGYQAILNYWNSAGPQPSAATAFASLLAIAKKSSLDSCTYLKDVTDALMRPAFVKASISFNTFQLPGTIPASQYDLGANGVAYSDLDYQTISQNPFTPWNIDWCVRNDGVDMSYSSTTNDFVVTHINNNEWLKYTFNLYTREIYDLSFQVASSSDTGRFHIELDGSNISGTIAVPNTGGMYNWTTIALPARIISWGNYNIKMVAEKGGFNFRQFSILLDPVRIYGPELIPPDESILRNTSLYPNPALNTLHVTTGAAKGAISIYSTVGKLVKTISNESHGSELIIDISDLKSGFYYLKVNNSTATGSRLTIPFVKK
ncbi:hypothetical protein BH09BAC2_BH09BAC2_04290 [soil metagenome]